MPILTDGTVDPSDLGPESGFEDFLANLMPSDARKEPSEESGEAHEEQHDETKNEEPEDDESPSEGDEDEGSEKDPEDEKSEDETKEALKKFAEDGAFFKIKVGDEEHQVPVKDLARLYGQEAALTQRGQKLADDRKAVETAVERNALATDALLQRAMKRWEPYSGVDFNLAAQQLSPEEYTALRNEAMAAAQDVAFLKEHSEAYHQHHQQTQVAALRERASVTLKELGDVEKGIQGWNEAMYSDMGKFAQSKYGVPAETFNSLVDSWAFRILHDAMAYHKAKDVIANVKVTKVNKTPKKVVKSSNAQNSQARVQKGSSAMQRLQTTGSAEDAAAAFLESLTDRD